MTFKVSSTRIVTILTVICFLMINQSSLIHANTATDLQAKIDQKSQDIQNLEKEIQGYQKQIDSLGDQANSLSSTLKSLDLTQKKQIGRAHV